MLRSLTILDLRGYGELEASFGPGPHLVWGPNAAGKTSLLEAIVLLGWGRSHRTSADAELVRWGRDMARVEGLVEVREADGAGEAGEAGPADTVAAGSGPVLAADRPVAIEVALVRGGAPGGRKRIRVDGAPRRTSGLTGLLRLVVFAPEEMLLIAGSPALRRTALDTLAGQWSSAYARDLVTYARALQQRNALLRSIREEQASRAELRFWDEALLDAGAPLVAGRLALLEAVARPLAEAHAEIAPDEAREAPLRIAYSTNAPLLPGESPRDALARRLVETADKEIWNGTTLVGPHRDDLVFEQAGRDLATFASRGQQRTAILAFKLAELDLLTALDGRPPLLLLDDVFSELDPERRAHLVRRIAALPQAFVTTTTLDDLHPALRASATSWRVEPASGGVTAGAGAGTARLVGPEVPV
ncbi:MAG: DNA replication/repair protein RecF [Candidatus Limnocylindrales bacterium]